MTGRELIDGAMLQFTAVGLPAPQGSKKLVGPWRMIDDNKQTLRSWRDTVAAEARAALAGRFGWPAGHPVAVSAVFSLPRPKSAPKRILLPAKKPDLDKLLRALFDSLKAAGVVHDDAQIVQVYVRKRFGLPLGVEVTVGDAP